MTAWAIVLAAAWWAEETRTAGHHSGRATALKYLAFIVNLAYTLWDALQFIEHGVL